MSRRTALCRTRYLRCAGSLGLGFSGAVSYANRFLDFWVQPPMRQIFDLLYLTLLFGLLAYVLIFGVTKRWLASFSLQAKAV
jgi:hypothetical protein